MRLVLLFIMCFSLSACAIFSSRSIVEPTANVQEKLVAPSLPRAEQPFLDIDSGGHKALIKDVVFTPDGRYLVSAGDDKVIRVWDIASGQTVRTLRGQSGEGNEGKIYAMALSPNGQWLAVGGLDKKKQNRSRACRQIEILTKIFRLSMLDIVLKLRYFRRVR